jgi:hypothetical protein
MVALINNNSLCGEIDAKELAERLVAIVGDCDPEIMKLTIQTILDEIKESGILVDTEGRCTR